MPQPYRLAYRKAYRANDGRSILYEDVSIVVSVGSMEIPEEVKKRYLAKNTLRDGEKVHEPTNVSWELLPHGMHVSQDRAAFV